MSSWESEDAAAEWDAGFALELPTRAEQQEVLLAILAATNVDGAAVLDLGVGSGLVAETVLETFPRSSVVGVDLSEAMLDLARTRLERFGSRVRLIRHDLAQLSTLTLELVAYRAVVSVQTLHHLADPEKAAALAWIADALEPGGVVVVVDRVAFPEPLFEQWAAVWRRLGADTPASYAAYLAQLAEAGDRPATLEDHLRWMRDANLDSACLHAYGNRAVLAGRKPH